MKKQLITNQAEDTSSSDKSGFTLIEMLVAIAVAITFVSGMFLTRGNFDSTVRLSSVTRDVGLLVRQAQTYGAGGGSYLEVGEPHGIYLDSSSSGEVILYADASSSPSRGYESSSADQAVDTLTITDPFTISDFCLVNTGSISGDCSSATSYPDDLSIYFIRPSLEANFQSNTANASSSAQAGIEITHEASGSTRLIIIDATGYISTS